jgi:tetratricopeptide (TPR) repeat protein
VKLSTFSAGDVAHIVGVTEARVRYWAQTGVVGPSRREKGRLSYSFVDLVGVRAAKDLLDRGVTLQRVRKNLEALRGELGIERPLSKLRVRGDGDRVVVSDGDQSFEPLTGQLVLDFGLDELAGAVVDLPQSKDESAWAWFQEASRAEEAGDDAEALTAYERAVAGDPGLAAAHTNIGNLLYRRGEGRPAALAEARAAYERALAVDPDQPEARFNLGNLLDELGEHAAARGEWLRVLGNSPDFADAHYNLAIASARDGDLASARFHLGRYRELVPDDDSAEEILSRL